MWNCVKRLSPSRSVLESCMFVSDFMYLQGRRGGGGSSLSARLGSNPVVVLARLSLLTGSVRRI